MKKNCSDCGNPIPAARLKSVPDTSYCVKCVDKHLDDRTDLNVPVIEASEATPDD